MEERVIIQRKPPKSPVAAGILAFLFPGTGALYNGQFSKGILFIIVFAGLITMQDHGGQPFAAFMLAGFYIYQIIEAIQTASAINRRALLAPERAAVEEKPAEAPAGSIFWGIVLIALGCLLILANFDVIRFDALFDFWPVAVIGIGLKLIADYLKGRNGR